MPSQVHSDVDTDALFRSHAAFVARFLFRLGVVAEDLDDVVQEVFLVVHEHGGYVSARASKTTYLASIALRAAASSRRRARTKESRWASLPPEALRSQGLDPVEVLEEHESMRRLQAALDRLNPELKATLILVELEGESASSVAAGMGVPIGTVYWRLHQARKLFMKAVEEMRAKDEPRAPSDEPSMRTMAIRSLFFWKTRSANDLLQVGRTQPPVRYDIAGPLSRHHALMRSGAPLPPWANPAIVATAKAASGLAAGLWVAGAIVALGAASAATHWAGRGMPRIEGAAPSGTSPTMLAATAAQDSPWSPVGLPSIAGVTPAIEDSAGSQRAATHRLPARPGARSRLRAAPADPVESGDTELGIGGTVSDAQHGVANGAVRTQAIANSASAPGVSPPPAPAIAQAAPQDVASATPIATPMPSARREKDDPAETEEVAAAGRLLASDPAGALAIVRRCEVRFPDGYMRLERRYVGVMALFGLARRTEAKEQAERFLRDYPDGAFSQRIRAAMAK
jgi:RNA polymerase sigma-70 factor, ECF subfamily